MDTMQWLTLVIFAVTILAVVTNVIDSTLAALIGVAVMIWAGVMSDEDAFKYVDWNVMAILVSIWLIAGYFGKSGVPSWLSVQALRLSGGHPGLLVMILTFLAGVISMFVYAISPSLLEPLFFIAPLVREGEVWRIVTWPIPNPPDIWTVIGLVFFWFVGHRVEDLIGHRRQAVLIAAMIVLPALVVTAIPLTARTAAA